MQVERPETAPPPSNTCSRSARCVFSTFGQLQPMARGDERQGRTCWWRVDDESQWCHRETRLIECIDVDPSATIDRGQVIGQTGNHSVEPTIDTISRIGATVKTGSENAVKRTSNPGPTIPRAIGCNITAATPPADSDTLLPVWTGRDDRRCTSREKILRAEIRAAVRSRRLVERQPVHPHVNSLFPGPSSHPAYRRSAGTPLTEPMDIRDATSIPGLRMNRPATCLRHDLPPN